MKSLDDHMNWNSAMDVIAGESIGTITFTRVCTALHPSILAASSNSFGTLQELNQLEYEQRIRLNRVGTMIGRYNLESTAHLGKHDELRYVQYYLRQE